MLVRCWFKAARAVAGINSVDCCVRGGGTSSEIGVTRSVGAFSTLCALVSGGARQFYV